MKRRVFFDMKWHRYQGEQRVEDLGEPSAFTEDGINGFQLVVDNDVCP